MAARRIIYIHPVHAVFQFTDLTHDLVTMQRFIELLESLELEDRYAIVNCVASLVGLTPCKPQSEPDLQLRRCRYFREACLRSRDEEPTLIRAFVEQVFDSCFLGVWNTTVEELSKRQDALTGELLSCRSGDFERNSQELWESADGDGYMRVEALRRYILFCERVAGPLVGYC